MKQWPAVQFKMIENSTEGLHVDRPEPMQHVNKSNTPPRLSLNCWLSKRGWKQNLNTRFFKVICISCCFDTLYSTRWQETSPCKINKCSRAHTLRTCLCFSFSSNLSCRPADVIFSLGFILVYYIRVQRLICMKSYTFWLTKSIIGQTMENTWM